MRQKDRNRFIILKISKFPKSKILSEFNFFGDLKMVLIHIYAFEFRKFNFFKRTCIFTNFKSLQQESIKIPSVKSKLNGNIKKLFSF
jgi:hypothetical protein